MAMTLLRKLLMCLSLVVFGFYFTTMDMLLPTLHCMTKHATDVTYSSQVGHRQANSSERGSSTEDVKKAEEVADQLFPVNDERVLWTKVVNMSNITPQVNFTTLTKNPCFFVKVTRNNYTEIQLKCIPYFLVIGFPKCGTTFLHSLIKGHPDVLKYSPKEIHYWCMLPMKNLTYYTSRFDKNSDMILTWLNQNKNKRRDLCPYIFGDYTPSTAWFMRYYADNLSLKDENLTPKRIYSLNPHTRIIVILREPVQRTLSSYKYFWTKSYRQYSVQPKVANNQLAPVNVTSSVEVTSDGFHEAAVSFVQWWRKCLLARSERLCALGFDGLESTFPERWNRSDHPTRFLRFRNSFYCLFLREWLKVFPSRNVLVIKFEDLIGNSTTYIRRYVYPFLGLPQPNVDNENQKRMEVSLRSQNVNLWIGDKVQLRTDTVQLLHNLFKPYNDRLSDLLNDSTFYWK